MTSAERTRAGEEGRGGERAGEREKREKMNDSDKIQLFTLPCPNPECKKKYAPQNWTKSRLRRFLRKPDGKLYCGFCDASWVATEEERVQLTRYV